MDLHYYLVSLVFCQGFWVLLMILSWLSELVFAYPKIGSDSGYYFKFSDDKKSLSKSFGKFFLEVFYDTTAVILTLVLFVPVLNLFVAPMLLLFAYKSDIEVRTFFAYLKQTLKSP